MTGTEIDGVTVTMDVLWGPKAGSPIDECRDITVLDEAICDRGGRREARAVLCDGATVGFDAARWATMTANAVIDAPPSNWTEPGFAQLVGELTVRWMKAPPDFASLYHEDAWRRGAATTVAAAAIEPSADGAVLRCLTVGDSMVAVIRHGELDRAWPTMSSGDFSTNPGLVATDGIDGAVTTGRTALREGDQVVLVSDAIAKWALQASTEGRPAWRTLASIDPSRFRTLVRQLREHGELDDDDVTVARATVHPRTGRNRPARVWAATKERVR